LFRQNPGKLPVSQLNGLPAVYDGISKDATYARNTERGCNVQRNNEKWLYDRNLVRILLKQEVILVFSVLDRS